MRNLGLIAFGVTTCALVPTARHFTHAGPKQVAKLVAAGERTISIGNAKVNVALDRAFVDAGDKVHLTLTASGETRQRITLDVLVLESTGTSGGRVETPPTRITRDEVTLDPKGTASKSLAFTLRGERAAEMEGTAPFGHYTFLVMPPADADKFERLRRRADRVQNPMDDSSGRVEAFMEAYRSIDREPQPSDDEDAAKPFGSPGQIARLDANTRPKDSPVSIVVPETAQSGSDIAVKVRIRNKSKQPVSDLAVHLMARPGYELASDYHGIDDDKVEIREDGQSVALAGHETKDVVFHVSTKETGTLGLFASVHCDGDGCYDKRGASELSDTAVDAIDIVPAEAPSVVGLK